MSSWDKEWAMCYSGRRVFPFDLQVGDIDITDIAHALAMQCRYNGHVSRFYSVGEHCLLISQALFRDTGDAVLALKGLLHDAGEAYTGDFTRPVKNSMREVGEVLHAAEDRNEETIFKAFGLDMSADHAAMIKDYDRRIIVDEKIALFGPNKPWDWDLEPLNVFVQGMTPVVCKAYYLEQFHDLSRRALHA